MRKDWLQERGLEMTATQTIDDRVVRDRGRSRNRSRWVLGTLAAAVLVIAAIGGTLWFHASGPPTDLDLSTTRGSAQGLYRVGIIPGSEPVPVNTLHSWTLHIETPDGRPVEHATVAVDGDMPQHGHGLPTRPQVTGYLGNGDYLVEGMKFQMGGWWVIDVDVAAAGQRDNARFNLILK